MIISKTPFRISLFGGGSDIPSYYEKYNGKVLGFTIDRFNYILFRSKFQNNYHKYNINYSLNEKTDQISSILHPSVRECMKLLKFTDPFELHYNGELPARSGLGSSSSFTVGLLKILYFIKKKKISKLDLAKKAIYIEQKKIGEFVGSQDQLFAALGGINKFEFSKKKILAKKIKLKKTSIKKIESSILLVFTGKLREAQKIEKQKFGNLNKKLKLIDDLKELVDVSEQYLLQDKIEIKDIGLLLKETWNIKKNLHDNVSNRKIDEMYELALKNGCYGGKVIGAGGGGFLLLLTDSNNKKKIKNIFKNNYSIDIKIDFSGSQIISKTTDY